MENCSFVLTDFVVVMAMALLFFLVISLTLAILFIDWKSGR